MAEILTDFPSRFDGLRDTFLGPSADELSAATVEHAWLHKGKVVLKLDGVNSISDAERLKGQYVFVREEKRMPLAARQYYLWELKGCRVVEEIGDQERILGTVTDVERAGGVDLLRVCGRSGEVLIPLAQSICTIIDTEAKRIVIDPPADLLEVNAE